MIRAIWEDITTSMMNRGRSCRKIPGVEFIEMFESREDSLCCGMGGGRIWQETEKNERFSNIRVEQAVEDRR